jgi:hypothetical protein
MLGWLQNNDTGAGWEAVRPLFAKHFSDDTVKTLDAQVAKQRQYQKEDREANRTTGRFTSAMRNMSPEMWKNLSPSQQAYIMGTGAGSQIEPAKGERFNITDKEKNGNSTITTKR